MSCTGKWLSRTRRTSVGLSGWLVLVVGIMVAFAGGVLGNFFREAAVQMIEALEDLVGKLIVNLSAAPGLVWEGWEDMKK